MKSIHTPAYQQLLDWLRQSREDRHLSLRDLGKRMGLPHSWIGKVETGERRLDVTEYVRLCMALDVDCKEGLAIVQKATSAPFPRAADMPLPKAADRNPVYRIPRRSRR